MISIGTILPIEILLQTVINEYLFNSYCVTVISETAINVKFPIPFTSIQVDGFTKFDDQMLKVSEIGCSDYVIKMQEPYLFMKTFENITHVGNARRSNKKLIFLPFDDDYNSSKLIDILYMKETSFVANVVLIIPDISMEECTSYDLVTHKFVGPDDEVNDPMYLDKWSSCTERFEKNVNLFPHNMDNLYGKTVNVSCFNYKPYVFLDLDPEITPLGRDGTEIRIVDEFCRWTNCTIGLASDNGFEWGDIYENNTGIGVLGNVIEDRADLAISALYSWYEYYIHLDFSAASIRTAITCIAPAPRLLASWELPLLPFCWHIWLAVVITFFFTSFAFAVAHGFSVKNAFLITFGTMIGQPHNDSTANWRVRSIAVWILLATLVITNAYGAGLASTFTVPKYEESIDTIQDIIDRNMEWGATHDAWIYSLTLSNEPKIKNLLKQFRIYSKEELKKRSFLRQMAFSIEKLPAGHFAIGEYITKEAATDLMIMQEDFYYEYNVVMMRKSSPFTNKMNDLIGRLHETGLLLAWETQVALKNLDNKVQIEVKLSRSKHGNDVVPLSFRHVLGIFFIYLGGVIASVVIFILELISKRENSESATTKKTYFGLKLYK